MIDPIREICGVSEVTHGFKKNLRKDAALNELNKDSGVVVERKCVCVWGEGGYEKTGQKSVVSKECKF